MVRLSDAKRDLEDHPTLNEADAQFGNEKEVIDVVKKRHAFAPLHDEPYQSEGYVHKRVDVEGQEERRLVFPLLKQNRPDIDDRQDQ